MTTQETQTIDENPAEVPADYVANLFDIRGRVAVVTGGGSGLGAAIATGFAQAGARVVVVDINDEGAAATVQKTSSTELPLMR